MQCLASDGNNATSKNKLFAARSYISQDKCPDEQDYNTLPCLLKSTSSSFQHPTVLGYLI